MSAGIAAPSGDAAPALPSVAIALPLLDPTRPTRLAWISRGFALALVIAIIVQASQLNSSEIIAAAPDGIAFWFTFAALYLALPIADWVIFRGIWRLPPDGIVPILRKRIANELLFDYSGEAWFYLWARRRTGLTAAPFGAIKDVNLLSALASNLWTLVLLALAFPFIDTLSSGDYVGPATLSAGIAVGLSLLMFVFRRRLLTLTTAQCARILTIHAVRIMTTTCLLGLVWHLALPDVAVGVWLALSALRLLVSRLPMLPAKDLLFTSIAMVLLGNDAAISALLALTAGLTLSTHLLLGIGLWLGALVEGRGETTAEPAT